MAGVTQMTNTTTTEEYEDEPLLTDQGSFSKQTFLTTNTVTNYMMYPLCFIGLLFCLFAVIVYASKNMRSPTSTYLISLNLTELANVVITVMIETTGLIYGTRSPTTYIYRVMHKYASIYIGTSMRRSTYCLSCILSTERFIAVAFPLKSKRFKLVRFPVATVLLTVIVNLLFHIFTILQFKIVSFQDESSNETLWKLQYTSSFLEHRSDYESTSHASKAIFVGAPLSVCLAMNILTVVSLWRNSKNRKKMIANDQPSHKSRNRRTTIIVLVSTCALVLLALPTNINSLIGRMTSAYGHNTREHYMYHTFNRVGKVCELVSNCCGFVFYMSLSSQFRETFVKIFCSPFTKAKPKIPSNFSGRTSSDSNLTNLSTVSYSM